MPILQSRMIALINAAIDYQTALNRLTKTINAELFEIQQGNRTAEDAIIRIASMSNADTLLNDAVQSQFVITTEHYHFFKNSQRNIRERKYQEKQRMKEGRLPERTHFEPPYATTEFSPLAQNVTPFRSEEQNLRGDIPKLPRPNYTPGELSNLQKQNLDKEVEKSLKRQREEEDKVMEAWDIGEQKEMDPNFDKTETAEFEE